MFDSGTAGGDQLRQVQPRWNKAMIVASIAISLLGAFTSTQLMCHARMSLHFSSVFVWALLGSLIYGFCSIWSLHEVAMLAYEFDVPIGVDAPLTIVSALLAVSFTFAAMAGDLLFDRYRSGRRRRRRNGTRHSRGKRIVRDHLLMATATQSATPLLSVPEPDEESGPSQDTSPALTPSERPSMEDYMQSNGNMGPFVQRSPSGAPSLASAHGRPIGQNRMDAVAQSDPENSHDPSSGTSSDFSSFRRLSATDSSSGSFGLSNVIGFIYRDGGLPAKNAFVATAKLLYYGLRPHNIVKGFVWSLAITSVHYVGIVALRIPNGYYTINVGLLILSALISWAVCTVGFILMAKMETHLPQQILFSVIATTGVAGMHFTGMAATTFWTTEAVSGVQGFPPALAGSVVGIAFVTCIAANVLLSHSATVSRNKLAEIVWTRKELFKNIALKEHAEAAARARSEFIASASHEIRTPLHHLQGYSDLLAQTELTEEGRELLTAIQRATKTLSLLTNNVLDWSRLEANSGEYRPTAVDLRTVCESIVTLLPNVDDDATIDIYVVVAPQVPETLFLDESWIHRILMNLLSNSLKFTKFGYILLSLSIQGDNLVAIVSDSGCGLDPNFIPDMWTPYKQGEARGSARGTGLGLSIIRQLVLRMNGSIEVESKYEHTEGVGPDRSGTKFTVTIPTHSAMPKPDAVNAKERHKIAILSDSGRPAEGLEVAWERFGFDVSRVRSVSELGGTSWTYVWAELNFLSNNKNALFQLFRREDLLTLIPYDTQDILDTLPGILTAPNIVLLHKPLIWHTFERRITATNDRRQSAAPSQALRFAPEVKVLTWEAEAKTTPPQTPAAPSQHAYTVLLVEDNPINRKLGAKMLQLLNYKTLLANDGEEALAMLLAHDRDIDCVLMDQSMPRMDGVTATGKIRKMEQAGRLRVGRPIIAVTAVVNSEAKEEFRDAGADDFLAKPLSLETLRDCLGMYLPAG